MLKNISNLRSEKKITTYEQKLIKGGKLLCKDNERDV